MTAPETLRELGEFALIDRLTAGLPGDPQLVLGVGDDAAVLRLGDAQWVVSCDASVEDVHFRRSTASAGQIGFKAAASALSDIAAMGATPRFLTLSLACPKVTEVAWLEAMFAGVRAAAGEAGAVVMGGDTTGSPGGVVLDVHVMGEARSGRVLYRSGARPGDVLAVTGWPGRAAAGLAALEQGLEAPVCIAAQHTPHPPYLAAQWLAGEPAVHAAIDVSDGLVQDAGHVARASGLAIRIDAAHLPHDEALRAAAALLGLEEAALALGGGEDYALLLALEADAAQQIQAALQARFDLPLHLLGECEAGPAGVRVSGAPAGGPGFDHFRT